MAIRQYLYNSELKGEAKILDEVVRVLHSVFDLDRDPDPADVQKFFVMLKPGSPEEMKIVKIERSSKKN